MLFELIRTAIFFQYSEDIQEIIYNNMFCHVVPNTVLSSVNFNKSPVLVEPNDSILIDGKKQFKIIFPFYLKKYKIRIRAQSNEIIVFQDAVGKCEEGTLENIKGSALKIHHKAVRPDIAEIWRGDKNCRLTIMLLWFLSTVPSIDSVDLSKCKVTEEHAEQLNQMVNLNTLILSESTLKIKKTKAVSSLLGKLTKFDITGVEINENMSNILSAGINLTNLRMDRCVGNFTRAFFTTALKA